MLAGIDISHYDGPIDFPQVAAGGMKFAYVKASEGKHTKDSLYSANYAGLKQSGIVRGAYHFFRSQIDAQLRHPTF